ncbi:sialin-like [Lutzomyia longipalpis]|uniref:sialin-like n=1 Tax=Lutzomyia longipalpis TaxID=7200 RepID=UPI0024840217|nr:sialin-like [Lutzomyia longipalpis]
MTKKAYELEGSSTEEVMERSTEQLEDSRLYFWKKRRYHVVLMIFFSLFCLLTMRMTLSVAIVAMTKKVNVTLNNGTVVEEQEFEWNSKQQGLILSSFFYGYIATQVVSGYFSSRFGGHLIIGISLLGTSILSVLIPLAAQTHIALFVFIRIIEGLLGGAAFTAIIALLANWAPVKERSFMTSISFMGFYIGNIAAMLLSGIIIVTWGWRVVFYIFGGIGFLGYILWLFLIKKSPKNDPFITEIEKTYILSSIGESKNKKISHPWKDMLTSLPVWAVAIGHFTSLWGSFTMQTQLPTFLNDIFNYNLDTTGILSSIPYIALASLLSVAGYFADWLQVKGYLTTEQVRRYFNSVTFTIQMIFMILVAFSTNPILTVVYLTLAVGVDAFAWSGYAINALDLAPSHAAIIKGIGITFGGFGGILSPLLAGNIVTDKSREQWQIVFFITAGIYLFGAVVSWFFVKGSIQPWAKIDLEELKMRNKS